MVTANARRQAAYRARRNDPDATHSERLNTTIDLHAKRALERLAKCYGVTQRAMLKKLIIGAEHAALDAVGALPDGQADYYDGKLRLQV